MRRLNADTVSLGTRYQPHVRSGGATCMVHHVDVNGAPAGSMLIPYYCATERAG
jgi:hypothetical protein